MRPTSTSRYIRFTIDDDLPQRALGLPGGRARPACGQRCNRCLRFTGFCLVCTGTLFQAVAPWVLSVVEAVGVLLMVFLLVPRPPGSPPTFDFRSNLEDLAAGSVVRAAVISGTYAYGTRRQWLRPYLYTAYAAGLAGVVYALVKAFLFDYGAAVWPAQAAVIGVFGAFSWVHVLAARDVVAWARKRAALGLATFPWEPGLREGLLLGGRRSLATPGGGSDDDGSGPYRGDVPPELLADPDSNFTPVRELWVHWKEALPPWQGPALLPPLPTALAPPPPPGAPADTAAADPEATAVVLIHSGGGGTFSWRHVIGDLAARCGVRVVAFDRAGFGLTSRPHPPHPSSGRLNPYSPAGQAALVLALCEALGIRRALLVAHGDGCLVAIMAAALVQRRRGLAASSAGPASARRAASVSIPGSGLLRADFSTDLGWPSSVGSSEADLASEARLGTAEAWRLKRDAPRASAGSPAAGAAAGAGTASAAAGEVACGSDGGGGGAAAEAAEALGRAGSGSEQGPLPGAVSFQSLLLAGEAGGQQQQQQQSGGDGSHQGHEDNQQPTFRQQQQQQKQQEQEQQHQGQEQQQQAQHQQQKKKTWQQHQTAGRPLSRLSQQSPPVSPLAAVRPPEPQAMSPGDGASSRGGSGSSGLAPQLWPSNAQQPAPPAPPQPVPPPPQPPQPSEPAETPHRALEGEGSFLVIGGDGGGGPGDGGYGLDGAGPCDLELLGVALLHPRLSGRPVGRFTRLLARAKLGRAMLRPLLRSELGEVANRRAWHRPDRCTRQVLDLYRRPLRAEGWDTALLATGLASGAGAGRRQVERDLSALKRLPTLVATGAHDKVSGQGAAARLAAALGGAAAVVPGCGHLSHEEAPEALLEVLAPFVSEHLA